MKPLRCLIGLHDWEMTSTPVLVPGALYYIAPCKCTRCPVTKTRRVDHRDKYAKVKP